MNEARKRENKGKTFAFCLIFGLNLKVNLVRISCQQQYSNIFGEMRSQTRWFRAHMKNYNCVGHFCHACKKTASLCHSSQRPCPQCPATSMRDSDREGPSPNCLGDNGHPWGPQETGRLQRKELVLGDGGRTLCHHWALTEVTVGNEMPEQVPRCSCSRQVTVTVPGIPAVPAALPHQQRMLLTVRSRKLFTWALKFSKFKLKTLAWSSNSL